MLRTAGCATAIQCEKIFPVGGPLRLGAVKTGLVPSGGRARAVREMPAVVMAKASSASALVSIASLVVLGIGAVAGPSAPSRLLIAVAVVELVFVVIAIAAANASCRVVSMVTALLAVLWAAHVLWQLAMAVTVVATLLLSRLVPSFRSNRDPLTLGRFSTSGAVLVGGLTPIALLAWLATMRPDLSDVVGRYIPSYPLPILLLGGVAFALVNAALEEAIWRGLLQEHLADSLGPDLSVALQAISFGVQHSHGVPRGLIGVILAGMWGAMLGVLRRRTGGLITPFVAHVVADSTIAVIMLFMLRR